jgi:hypothetical protein
MRVLVQAQIAHIAQSTCERGSYQEQHSPYIAAHTSVIQLYQPGGNQVYIVLRCVIVLFPGFVPFQCVELGRGGFPFIVGFGLRCGLVSM